MSRRRLLVILAPALGLALAACATTQPGTSVTSPAPVSTPTSGSATPSATATTSPSTPTPTQTEDEGANLVLRGDGLATFRFGAKQLPVMELLEDQLGEPDESSQGILCQFDDSSPWAQTIVYGGLWVQFEAKDQKKSSPRSLAAWGFQLSEEFAEPLQLADDVPLNLDFKQLRAKYPDGKLKDLGLGDGVRMFTLPNKMRFIGASKPDSVSAGSFGLCE